MNLNHKNAVLCVWPGTFLGGCNNEATDEDLAEFHNWLDQEFNVTGQYEGEFMTLPGQGGEGGRSDLLFWVSEDDVPRFALPRLYYGIRWWDDYVNGSRDIIPADILKRYAGGPGMTDYPCEGYVEYNVGT